MLPVYDPKSFSSVDLRKYHVRTLKDIIKFQEFVISRMEECKFVLNKTSNKLITFDTMKEALRKQQEKQQQTYGAATRPEETTTEPEIQKVDTSLEKEHQALLDEMRQAVADESLAPAKDDEAKLSVEFDKYKVVDGKVRPMFFRNNGAGFRMISVKDVPSDIKKTLMEKIEEQRANGKEQSSK